MKKIINLFALLSGLTFLLTAQAFLTPELPLPQSTNNWTPAVSVETNAGNPSQGFVETLVPLFHDYQSVFFIDGQGSLSKAAPNFPTNKNQTNFFAALGYRHQFKDFANLGAYVGYETEKTAFETHAQQFDVGIEFLGPIDFRFNLYLPKKDQIESVNNSIDLGPESVPILTGNQVYLETFTNNVVTQNGFDVEAGLHIPTKWIRDIGVFGGYYHYNAEANARKFDGPMFRIDVSYNRHFHLVSDYSNDPVQGKQFRVGLLVTYGGSPGYLKSDNPQSRLTENLHHHLGAIVAPSIHSNGTELIKDHVYYINSAAAPGGDGTFERPWQDTTAFDPGAVESDAFIYVYHGTGVDYSQLGSSLQGTQTIYGQGQTWTEQGYTIIAGEESLRPILIGQISTSAGSNNTLVGFGLDNVGLVAANGIAVNIVNASNATLDNVDIGQATEVYQYGVALGFAVEGGSVTINNSRISTTATTDFSTTSAILNIGGTATIDSSTLNSDDGGGIATDANIITVNPSAGAITHLSNNTILASALNSVENTRGVTGIDLGTTTTMLNDNVKVVVDGFSSAATGIGTTNGASLTATNVNVFVQADGFLSNAFAATNGPGTMTIEGGRFEAISSGDFAIGVTAGGDPTFVNNATIIAIATNGATTARALQLNNAPATLTYSNNTISASTTAGGTVFATFAGTGTLTDNGGNTCTEDGITVTCFP